MLISKPSGGDLAVKDVPDGHCGLGVLSGGHAPTLPLQRGRRMAPQPLPVPYPSSDSTLSLEHWRGMAEEPMAKAQGGPRVPSSREASAVDRIGLEDLVAKGHYRGRCAITQSTHQPPGWAEEGLSHLRLTEIIPLDLSEAELRRSGWPSLLYLFCLLEPVPTPPASEHS